METGIFVWLLVGGLVGAICGEPRRRPVAGAVLGVLLGPIGWLIVLASDDRLSCPHCGGKLPMTWREYRRGRGVTVCSHCGRDFAAYRIGGLPHRYDAGVSGPTDLGSQRDSGDPLDFLRR